MTITIGIPTFNEENNITFLLEQILKQSTKFAKIEKIHIVDDASTDRTVELAKAFKNKKIIVTRREKRLGQTSAQNYIFEHTSSEAIIILEADTYPAEKNYIELMIEPFIKNSDIGFVQGNITPLPTRTLIGKVLNKQAEVFTKLVVQNTKFSHPISTGRGGKAFRKSVYKKLRWPTNVPEDDYAILWCIAHNVTSFFQRKAHMFYGRPQTFTDYIKEKQKMKKANYTIKNLFSTNVIGKYFRVPIRTQIKLCVTLLKEDPTAFFIYGFLTIAEYFVLRNETYTDFWPQTQTTKMLHANLL